MPEQVNYAVESKEEIRRLDRKTGEPYVAYRIWATTKKGTYFHIDIPEGELDKAPTLLDKKAKQLDAI